MARVRAGSRTGCDCTQCTLSSFRAPRVPEPHAPAGLAPGHVVRLCWRVNQATCELLRRQRAECCFLASSHHEA